MNAQLAQNLRALLRSWPSWIALLLCLASMIECYFKQWGFSVLIGLSFFLFVPARVALMCEESLLPLLQQKGAAPYPPLALSTIAAHYLTGLIQALVLLACCLIPILLLTPDNTVSSLPLVIGLSISIAFQLSVALYVSRFSALLLMPALLFTGIFCLCFSMGCAENQVLGEHAILPQALAILYAIPFLAYIAARPELSTKQHRWLSLILPALLLLICAGAYTFDTGSCLGRTLAENATSSLFQLLILLMMLTHAIPLLRPQQNSRWLTWRAPLTSLIHILLATGLVWAFQHGEYRGGERIIEFLIHSLYTLVMLSGFLLIWRFIQWRVIDQAELIISTLMIAVFLSLPAILLLAWFSECGLIDYLFNVTPYGESPNYEFLMGALLSISILTALRARLDTSSRFVKTQD